MSKSLFVAITISVALVCSCTCSKGGGDNDNSEASSRQVSEKEKMTVEVLKVDFKAFSESVSRMKNLPIVRDGENGLKLSEKDKMVKPGYLIDPSIANSMVELAQKYRMVSMLRVDAIIADLYDMPVDAYREACIKLLSEINDSAFLEFAKSDSLPSGEQFSRFLDKEYDKGRERFFWESVASCFIEQLYVCTQDVDRFMSMFDDDSASEVTYNFVLIHDGVSSLLEMNPEMQGLQNVLLPLYVINATCVDELRGQIIQLKEDIASARAYLIK